MYVPGTGREDNILLLITKRRGELVMLEEHSQEPLELINSSLYHQNEIYKSLINRIPIRQYHRISAINAVRHGMNNDHILPCRKQSCFYQSLCFLAIEGDLESIPYGEPCAIEFSIYLHLAEGFAIQFEDRQLEPGLVDKLYRLIMIEIKQYRIRGMRSIESGVLERPGVPRWNYKGLNLSYRYSTGLLEHKMKVVADLLDLREEIS